MQELLNDSSLHEKRNVFFFSVFVSLFNTDKFIFALKQWVFVIFAFLVSKMIRTTLQSRKIKNTPTEESMHN